MENLKKLLLTLMLLCAAPLYAAEDINLNTATAQEIASAMKGVGEKKAERIIEYREQHGDFTSIDELTNVKGIGEITIEQNKDVISVN